MKPSWNDAPEWAQYLAMDSDGGWYWYAVEPYAGDGTFVLSDNDTRFEFTYISNWQDSLESRPEPEATK